MAVVPTSLASSQSLVNPGPSALTVILLVALTSVPPATEAQAVVESSIARLELQKLELEIAKLAAEQSLLGQIRSWVLPVLVGVLGLSLNVLLFRWKRESDKEAARFSALAGERTSAYAEAFRILKPTALFFPAEEANTPVRAKMLRAQQRVEMGRALSDWYFGSGGALMSRDARKAYFKLMSLLKSAQGISDGDFASPDRTEHQRDLSIDQINLFRRELGFAAGSGSAVENSRSNDLEQKIERLPDTVHLCPLKNCEVLAARYCHYILLQTAASYLRTALTRDIGSREPPAG